MTGRAASGDLALMLNITREIMQRVEVTLLPLQLEMDLMAWKPGHRAIVWEAVAREAMRRADDPGRAKSSAAND